MVHEKVQCVGQAHPLSRVCPYIQDVAGAGGCVGWNDQRVYKGGIDPEDVFTVKQGYIDAARIGAFKMNEVELQVAQRVPMHKSRSTRAFSISAMPRAASGQAALRAAMTLKRLLRLLVYLVLPQPLIPVGVKS